MSTSAWIITSEVLTVSLIQDMPVIKQYLFQVEGQPHFMILIPDPRG